MGCDFGLIVWDMIAPANKRIRGKKLKDLEPTKFAYIQNSRWKYKKGYIHTHTFYK